VIVEWTPRASRELLAQLQFIAEDKPSAAERMAGLVAESTSLLANWPQLGKATQIPDVYNLVIPRTPFVAVYRLNLGRVTILRLFHGAQQTDR